VSLFWRFDDTMRAGGEKVMNEQRYGGRLQRTPYMTDEHWAHEKRAYFLRLCESLEQSTSANRCTDFRLERFETDTELQIVLTVDRIYDLPPHLLRWFNERVSV
jgi:hypothetical protein